MTPEQEQRLDEAMKRATRRLADDLLGRAKARQPYGFPVYRYVPPPVEATSYAEGDATVHVITTLEETR